MRAAIAAAAGAAVLAVGGYATADQLGVAPLSPSATTTVTTEPTNCEDWAGNFTVRECHAAGAIRFVALYNLQGAAQFCKWKTANPGEWSRLNGFASSGTEPTQIITWLGGSIKNEIEAYFAAGWPTFTIQPNTAPNICGGKLVAPPVVGGVTPDQTGATVTITP